MKHSYRNNIRLAMKHFMLFLVLKVQNGNKIEDICRYVPRLSSVPRFSSHLSLFSKRSKILSNVIFINIKNSK